MVNELASNDLVRVKGTEFTGRVVFVSGDGKSVNLAADLAPGEGNTLTVGNVPVTWLELAEPYSWPPETGDIWKVPDSGEYAAAWCGDLVMMVPMDSDSGDLWLDDFKGHNPVLVRRRGVQP